MKRKIYKPSARSNISPFYVMNLLEKAKKMELEEKKSLSFRVRRASDENSRFDKRRNSPTCKKRNARIYTFKWDIFLEKKISDYYKLIIKLILLKIEFS